jgi:hypothetical protein
MEILLLVHWMGIKTVEEREAPLMNYNQRSTISYTASKVFIKNLFEKDVWNNQGIVLIGNTSKSF